MSDLEDEINNILDESKIINLMSLYSDTKLADIIVSYRYLGLFKNLFTAAMEELAKRRASGNIFNYENYIEENLQALPKLDFKVPDIGSLIGSLKGFKKK